MDHLPFTLKVLLDNLLRYEDGQLVTAEQVEALLRWGPTAEPRDEVDPTRLQVEVHADETAFPRARAARHRREAGYYRHDGVLPMSCAPSLALQAAEAVPGDLGRRRVEDLAGGQPPSQPRGELIGGDLGPFGEDLGHLPADVRGEDHVGGGP